MSKNFLLYLILTEAVVYLAMADTATAFANTPAPSPSASIRKLEKHQPKLVKSSAAAAPTPQKGEEKKPKEVGSENEHNRIAQSQDIHIEKKHHHHSIDKSFYGGGVILGGLATAFFVAIVCYIRATRRKHAKPSASSAA
ncbi:hypothetical protein A4A49_24387 [Nicotiana attenuata]|uniref:Uncharacterized protein n=1 Tax=Nicotiana attenuata TaxID=49451 RepID=A0A314KV69_NICAT|nr:hypothetical protein A4A49_24387 [Nicotiana attenuata]